MLTIGVLQHILCLKVLLAAVSRLPRGILCSASRTAGEPAVPWHCTSVISKEQGGIPSLPSALQKCLPWLLLWIIPAGTWATSDTPKPSCDYCILLSMEWDLWTSSLEGLGLWPISVASTTCVFWTIFCSAISAVTPLTSLVSEGTFLVNTDNINSDQVTCSRFCQQAKNHFVTWR